MSRKPCLASTYKNRVLKHQVEQTTDLMTRGWNDRSLAVYLLCTVVLCVVHADVSLTEPRLISIAPISSTALVVRWEFADAAFDQSDLIQISITFNEFFFNYNSTPVVNNFTFTAQNKTITTLTRTFPLVNAFYYVCFSSNSTSANSTRFVFSNKCSLVRTCERYNTSVCLPASFVRISTTNISSNAFTILIQWLKNLPYTRNSATAQLIGQSGQGTALSAIENDTYISFPFRFSGLSPNTTYTVNTSTSYRLLDQLTTNIQTVSVTTSGSTHVFFTGGNSSLFFLSAVWLFCRLA